MMSPQLQTIAGMAVGRILNSLPEGLFIALFAWTMLRLLPRQNSRTRFAVWFVALLAVAALPVAGLSLKRVIAGGHSLSAAALSARDAARPLITLPGTWGPLLFLAWLLAVAAAILRLAYGLWRLRSLRSSCIAIDPAQLDPTIQKTVAAISSLRPVTLAASENVSVPAALGFFKPMIVLPAWALRELPPDELNIILLHEFAHLRRWDDWTNLLQKVVRALFLFHPAVWWIDRRLALEREMACDDEVLAQTDNPRGYAKCLIGLLEKSFARRRWTMAQAAVHRASEASLRLAQILDMRRPLARNVWKPALAIVGSFSLLCLMFVPRVPEIVAFDRHAPATVAADLHTATLSQPEFPAAVTIPAALHTESAPSRAHAGRPAGAFQPRSGERVQPGARPELAEGAQALGPEPNENKPQRGERTAMPVETLLLVRTTQRIGPDSWVWSISMWRVTWLNLDQDETGRAPIPKKT
jgi:beta-lactamase regulating signal transducer with metallopeptidase domain